jgi:hypothetical protein
MIIVKLMGGLGNQMFQYALGRHLSEIHKVTLKFDQHFLIDRTPRPDFTYRDYELGIFKINESFASVGEVRRFCPRGFWPRLWLKLNLIFTNKEIKKEEQDRYYPFDASVLKAGSNTYLDGFWQSGEYFKDISDILKKEFQFKESPHANIISYLDKIKGSNSISIHIRRGDYVTSKSISNYHGVCSLDYYNNSVKYVAEKIDHPEFFVFSDDIEWAKQNLKINFPHLFIQNDRSVPAYEDMRLMTACKHNIIANSSFSWWAAWLNNNPEKIVVAPLKWFVDPTYNVDNLVPANWVKI